MKGTRRSTTRAAAIIAASLLATSGCGGSERGVAEVASTDVATSGAAAPDDGAVASVGSMSGRATVIGAPEDVVATRDALADRLGERPAFDAVVLALAAGYVFDQIATGAAEGSLEPDGSIGSDDAPIDPLGPPSTALTAGPMGLRHTPAAPVSQETLDELWQATSEVASTWQVPELRDEPGLNGLYVLEQIIMSAAMGLTLDEIVAWRFFGIAPPCERFDGGVRVPRLAGIDCERSPAPLAEAEASDDLADETTESPESLPATAEEPSPETEEHEAVETGQAVEFTGTVSLPLAIENEVVEVNELRLIVADVGLAGLLDYRTRGNDGTPYCIEFSAFLNETLVPRTGPNQYAGSVFVDGTHWTGDCGAGEATPFGDLELGLAATVSGDTITGTLTADGDSIDFTARRTTPES